MLIPFSVRVPLLRASAKRKRASRWPTSRNERASTSSAQRRSRPATTFSAARVIFGCSRQSCMLYLPLITLIFYRFTFVNVTMASLTPPYWINMGAVAITTLAGARLIIAAPGWPLLNEVVPFLKGFTLFFWAAGTWWIPLLFILGFWRHVYKRFPLKYDPQYWGMVFPFGMYTVCTFQLAKAINFHPLMVIPRYFIYLALAGWIAASIGLISKLTFRRHPAP